MQLPRHVKVAASSLGALVSRAARLQHLHRLTQYEVNVDESCDAGAARCGQDAAGGTMQLPRHVKVAAGSLGALVSRAARLQHLHRLTQYEVNVDESCDAGAARCGQDAAGGTMQLPRHVKVAAGSLGALVSRAARLQHLHHLTQYEVNVDESCDAGAARCGQDAAGGTMQLPRHVKVAASSLGALVSRAARLQHLHRLTQYEVNVDESCDAGAARCGQDAAGGTMQLPRHVKVAAGSLGALVSRAARLQHLHRLTQYEVNVDESCDAGAARCGQDAAGGTMQLPRHVKVAAGSLGALVSRAARLQHLHHLTQYEVNVDESCDAGAARCGQDAAGGTMQLPRHVKVAASSLGALVSRAARLQHLHRLTQYEVNVDESCDAGAARCGQDAAGGTMQLPRHVKVAAGSLGALVSRAARLQHLHHFTQYEVNVDESCDAGAARCGQDAAGGTMQLPRHVKVAAGSLGALVFGALFGWAIFPTILKGQLKKEMALSQKTDVREMWTKVPFAIDFKVWVFNYTNPEEIQNGGVPIVKEVGPYYFEEWKEKVEMEDQEEEDTITYKKVDTFYFKKELSGAGLTGEETVTVPNVFMMSIAQVVEKDKPSMLNVVAKAIKAIFADPPDVFIRVKVLDLLFHGVIINCKHTEFAPKALCTALKKEATGLVFGPDNQYEFSLFGMRNGTVDANVMKVKRGVRNVMDVGQVVEVNGEPELTVWRDHCNHYDGTDGTVFPPFLTQRDRLQSYSPDLCRSFKPWYQKKTSYSGIKTNRYVANIGDFSKDEELNCFCDAPDQCPSKGLMDLFKCIKAPLFASMPHFLDCDPSVMKGVKGLNPNVESHGIYIDFEPLTGTPMEARQRIQFNIMLKRVDKIELFDKLPGVLAPIFWVEEGLALNATFVKMLNNQLFRPLRIVGVLKWLLVCGGGLGAVGGAVYHFKGPKPGDRIMKFAVNPDSPGKKKVQPVESEEPKEVSVIGQIQDNAPTKITM